MTIAGDLQGIIISNEEDYNGAADDVLDWLSSVDVITRLDREGISDKDLDGYYNCVRILQSICKGIKL